MEAPNQNVTSSAGRWRCFFVANIILSIFALVLQVVGYVTPGWAVTEYGTESFKHSIWYAISCDSDNGCETYPLVDDKEGRGIMSKDVKSSQILTTFALAFTITAIVLLILGRGPQSTRTICLKMVGSLMALTSGILSLVTSGKLGDETFGFDIATDAGEDWDIIKFPYSLFLFGLGGLILCIMAFLMVVDILISLHQKAILQQNGARIEVTSGQIYTVSNPPAMQASNQPVIQHQPGKQVTGHFLIGASNQPLNKATSQPSYKATKLPANKQGDQPVHITNLGTSAVSGQNAYSIPAHSQSTQPQVIAEHKYIVPPQNVTQGSPIKVQYAPVQKNVIQQGNAQQSKRYSMYEKVAL